MKLELKHIAPYLPYGIKLFDQWDESDNGYILEVHGFDGEHQEWLIYDNLDGNHAVICKSLVKMVLRPLSDLTKEIEHNRGKFIPMNVVGEVVNDFCKCDFVSDWSSKGDCFETYVDEFIKRIWNNHHLDYLPFGFVQKLLEWHFDIFGLIENGLAVDINTLNK